MQGELTRGKVAVALAAGAAACGAAAGLLFGPVWTIAGVLVGPLIGAVALARGWHLAAGQDLVDELREAAPVIKAAYHADPVHFSAVWQAETGAEPPDWLIL